MRLTGFWVVLVIKPDRCSLVGVGCSEIVERNGASCRSGENEIAGILVGDSYMYVQVVNWEKINRRIQECCKM